MNIQALFDGLSAEWQRERAETQMTLGQLIEILESMPADTEIRGLNCPHSYRGYYSDLAFEPTEGTVTVSELLSECKAAMGQVFEGYKGGDYVMGALTPIWVAYYGHVGQKLIALHHDGTIETADDEE